MFLCHTFARGVPHTTEMNATDSHILWAVGTGRKPPLQEPTSSGVCPTQALTGRGPGLKGVLKRDTAPSRKVTTRKQKKEVCFPYILKKFQIPSSGPQDPSPSLLHPTGSPSVTGLSGHSLLCCLPAQGDLVSGTAWSARHVIMMAPSTPLQVPPPGSLSLTSLVRPVYCNTAGKDRIIYRSPCLSCHTLP